MREFRRVPRQIDQDLLDALAIRYSIAGATGSTEQITPMPRRETNVAPC
jgi:hypothetical protein